MRYFYCSLWILLSFISLNANAFKVDSLLKVMDDKDSYVVVSSSKQTGREYIHISLSSVDLHGESSGKEMPLDPKRVAEWPVLLEPSEIILDAGDEVRVKIIRNSEPQLDDMLIGVSFIPDAESMNTINSTLQVSVGYKTWLVIPGKSPFSGSVTAKRDAGNVTISNASNKIIRVLSDECIGKEPSSCVSSIISLPGTTKRVDAASVGARLSFYEFSNISKKIKEVTL